MIKGKVAFLGLGACGSNIALLLQQKQTSETGNEE